MSQIKQKASTEVANSNLDTTLENAPNDLELVRRAKEGNLVAFEMLVKRYQSRVVSLANRYMKDISLANDVSQESFVKAYKGLHKFRGDSAFYTWLYRIVTNTAKNHLVMQARKMPDLSVDASEAEQFGDNRQLQDNATPEKELLADEIKMAVLRVIDGLPEDLNKAILLREMDGLSYDEIAERMDCPVGTVRSRIFRAREAIDKEINHLLN